MNNPPKLKVLQVGCLDEEGRLVGFCFSGEGIPGATTGEILTETGENLIGGYTYDELVQMINDEKVMEE